MSFRKNQSAIIHFSLRDLGGQLPSSSLTLLNTDCVIRKGSNNFAYVTYAPVEDATKYGHYILTLTADELNADVVTVLVQKSGWRDFEITIYPESLLDADLYVDTTSEPWELQYRERGTSTIIMKKKLYQVTGDNVTKVSQAVGRQIHTS